MSYVRLKLYGEGSIATPSIDGQLLDALITGYVISGSCLFTLVFALSYFLYYK